MWRASAGLIRLAALAATTVRASSRPSSCPEPWKESHCLGASGVVGGGNQVHTEEHVEQIKWQEGMSGHSHYSLNASHTALFVIAPLSSTPH
mmetsp:Transcript_96054/g.299131  ORF Transcript_96054/g.299131 Transcript_96054/m.299131 type:complete len:92 (-) Transcript_96054:276-551(-)